MFFHEQLILRYNISNKNLVSQTCPFFFPLRPFNLSTTLISLIEGGAPSNHRCIFVKNIKQRRRSNAGRTLTTIFISGVQSAFRNTGRAVCIRADVFRVRVDNGLTQRNAGEGGGRGGGEERSVGWSRWVVVIRRGLAVAGRGRAGMASTRFASFVNDSRPINRHRQIVAADSD